MNVKKVCDKCQWDSLSFFEDEINNSQEIKKVNQVLADKYHLIHDIEL